MRCHELAIEERESSCLHSGYEPREGDLRSVGRTAEHALAEESAAQLHPIKAAHELTRLPHLHRMSMAGGVKRDHRSLDFGVDPSLFAIGAGKDHSMKCLIQGNCETARP